MSDEIHPVNLQNVPEAISLVNESCRGTSAECNLDFFNFMSMARYWNFSFDHSLLYYVDGEPAGVAIHSTEPEVHEAFTFHWGTLPKFRTRRIAISLAEACAKKLRGDGYVAVYGDSLPERPVRRWRFVHFMPLNTLHAMHTPNPNLPAPNPRYQVRVIAASELSQFPQSANETVHWCQRLSFLSNAARFHIFLGAFEGDVLKAYAVALAGSAATTITDLRSAEPDLAPGYELLRFLLEHNYRPPFTATHAFDDSYLRRLLLETGFTDKSQFAFLRRDLLTTA
jgi:hypothetical protein